MKRILVFPALMAFLAGCGGGEPSDSGDGASGAGSQPAPAPTIAAPAVPGGPMTMPDWFQMDSGAQTVHLIITAGSTSSNNYWNMNGAIRGTMAVNVPEGYTVTIDFVNRDPNMAHGLTISRETKNFVLPPSAETAFPGAGTENPNSMLEATLPGETETIQFVASEAGLYSMICLIPGHSAVGMWLWFIVISDGQAGVQGA